MGARSLETSGIELDGLPAALTVIFGHEDPELLAAERRGGIARQRGVEKPLGQRVFVERPAGQQVELPLGATMRLAVSRSSSAVVSQPVTRRSMSAASA